MSVFILEWTGINNHLYARAFRAENGFMVAEQLTKINSSDQLFIHVNRLLNRIDRDIRDFLNEEALEYIARWQTDDLDKQLIRGIYLG